MPYPKTGESKRAYLMRAVPFMIREEGLKPNQAAGKARGMWAAHRKKGRKPRAKEE